MRSPFDSTQSPAGTGFSTRIPSLEEVSPAYVALIAKQVALQTERQLLEDQRKDLAAEIKSRKGAGYQAIRNDATDRDERIALILGEDAPHETKLVSRTEALREIEAHIEDLDRAQSIVAERVAAERMRASQLICETMGPVYNRLVDGIVAHLAAAMHAADAYRTFAQSMNEKQIAWSSINREGAIGIGVGGLGRTGSPIDLWLRAALKRGHGNHRDLPESIR